MARPPLTIVAVVLELALILAGSGVPPSRLWQVLAARRTRSTWASASYCPVAFLVYATILIGSAAALDVAIHRRGLLGL